MIVDPPGDARITHEEIFGPAVSVIGYDTYEKLVADLQGQAKPLALYYFGIDKREKATLLERVPSGGAMISDVLLHASAFDAPFGGAGLSGMGCFNGREGFEKMSYVRTVFRAVWWDPRKAFGLLPPYSEKLRRMIDGAIKRASR